MKDYGRIITKIGQTPWLITPEGLQLVLDIIESRINNGPLDDREFQMRVNGHDGGDQISQIVNGVGILPIQGPIFGKSNLMTQMSGATSLEMLQSEFRALMSDNKVHSVLLDVDSPGGTSDLVKEFADELYAARDNKPVYSIANTLSGSAAYYLMSQATASYATPSALVGSIGVYTVHEDQSGADAQAGRKFTYVSAGKYKTEANPHEPLSQEATEHRQSVADEIYEEFLTAVARGRNIDPESVRNGYGEGRVLTATKALESGMIDGVFPYETLVNAIAANGQSRPQQVQVSLDGRAIAATLFNGVVNLESKDLEHSEPGTGVPPKPRTEEDGSDELGDRNRSRADRLPLLPTDPTAPKPNSLPALTTTEGGDNAMNEEQLKSMCKLLGLPEDSTFEQVMEATESQTSEAKQLRTTVAASNQEMQLSEQYPEFYKEHMDLVKSQREIRATNFVESVASVTRPDGDKFVPTKHALSSMARTKLSEIHTKFSVGTGTVADFEEAINAVMHGGILEYGEIGSSLSNEVDEIPNNIADIRSAFALKVAEIQKADNLEYRAAIDEAAKRYPELAAAYNSAVPSVGVG